MRAVLEAAEKQKEEFNMLKTITSADCAVLETAWAVRDVLRITEANYRYCAEKAGVAEDPEVLRRLLCENVVGALPAIGSEERVADAIKEIELACACDTCGQCPLRMNVDCELLRIGLRLAE